METNLTLIRSSPKSFVCNLPDSGRHVTRPNQGLSTGRRENLGTRLNERVIEHEGKFNFSLTPSLACQLFTDIYVAITKFNLVDYHNTTEERPRFLCFLSPPSPPFAVIFLLTHPFASSPQCKRQEQACVREQRFVALIEEN